MRNWTLTQIERAIRAGWSADTCSPDDVERELWNVDNPAWGQCDITALVVNDLLGGDLVLGEVFHDGGQQGYHWWNRLPGGVEIDLTREQFRLGQTVTAGHAIPRPPGRLHNRWAEYELLRARVGELLGEPLPSALPEPVRAAVSVDGRVLSYLDFGGSGRVLFALHGHFQEGRTFTRLARALAPDWRVIALDQRGHGFSDRPAIGADSTADFSPAGYVADAAEVLRRLDLGPATVLGHSLGGLVAFQLAAEHPELVNALIIEDVGAEVDRDLSYCLDWPHRAPTRGDLVRELGEAARFLTDAIREYPDGWGLAFRPQDMVTSGGQNKGERWAAWLATDCPALLFHGLRSPTLSAELARQMVERRPNTRLVELDTGHTVHESDPDGFTGAVREFLGAVNGL